MCEAARKKKKKKEKGENSAARSGLSARSPIVAEIVASVTANGLEPLRYASESHSNCVLICETLPVTSLRRGHLFCFFVFSSLFFSCL